MNLTTLSFDFKMFILLLGLGGFVLSHFAERRVLPRLAWYIEKTKVRLWPKARKKRKQYKEIQDNVCI